MANSIVPNNPNSAPAVASENQQREERLRQRLAQILGADRWVVCDYPTVAPKGADEVQRLLKDRPAPVVAVGQGSSFPENFEPNSDTIILLTSELKHTLELSRSDQTLSVDSGYKIADVNDFLENNGFIVPALKRFSRGSVGGRLASVSSRPFGSRHDGWIQSLLGLDVIMPSGEYLKMGGQCIKDVAGYDLKHLFTGSKGNIGIIVKAIFRACPISSYTFKEDDHTTPDKNTNSQKHEPPTSSRFSPGWKRLLDPMGRMDQGA